MKVFYLAVVALAACLLPSVLAGCDHVECPTTCGEGPQSFADPQDCSKFCRCEGGSPTAMSCPDGLHFNAATEICDWPANVNCGGFGGGGNQRGCEAVSPQCPPTNVGNAIHLPHPDTCGAFCKCDWGNAIYFDCPGGLHFNAVLQVCDWPANAGCQDGGDPPGTGEPQTTTERVPNPTTTSAPTGCEPVAAQCPATNEGNATHLPHPTNCGAFCKCDWGNAIYFDCPGGLHFNPVLQVCDWPQFAGCDPSQSTAAPTKPPAPTTVDPVDPPTTTENGGDPPVTGCENVRCPEENGEFALHLPHPSNCGAFCKCDWGVPIYFDCPGGLHFNPVLEVCDWPNAAGCDPSQSTKPPAPTTVDPVDPPTTTENGGDPTGSPTGCENVRCPEENGEFALHLPHPSNCGAFCKCDWGVPIYFDCPGGLHFNPVLEVCDWPNAAGCDPSQATNPPAPTTVDPVDPPTTTENGGDPTGLPTGCENVRCPEENGEFALHLPHPSNCGAFCKCDWGVPIYFDCPGGLHFNPVLEVCDWPSAAGCDPSQATNPPAPTTTADPPTTENGGGGDITGTAAPTGCEPVAARCPATNEGNATHLPHPTNCGAFCKCDWGNAIYFDCPGGLHFNPVLQVCDWPNAAGCESPPNTGNDPTDPPPVVPITGCEHVKCPAVNGELALHLPNPLNCVSFCKCDWGTAYYFDCPEGLHFNSVEQVCDWPQDAGCSYMPAKK